MGMVNRLGTTAPKPEATTPAVVKRPLPDQASQMKSNELLNEVYGKQIAAAHSRDSVLVAIAEEMSRKAADSQNDPGGLFALPSIGRECWRPEGGGDGTRDGDHRSN